MRGRSWAIWGLVAVLVFDVWWRCHSVGPALRDRLGFAPYFATGAESDPLDCDESVYAYIGGRLSGGSVMYRDLTENKPPLGYWLYALGVTLGGETEFAVRLMPIPLALGTVFLVWRLGLRLGGPLAAVVAAVTYAVVSTDPFLYGNGAQMEQMINLFSVAGLWLLVSSYDRPGRARVLAAGVCLGLSALVKQVAAVNGLVYAAAIVSRSERPRVARLTDLAALTLGFASACGLAASVLVLQGAGGDAFDDVFRYGRALATDIPADPRAPSALVRWFTGNASPTGELPPPFGRSDYLVWWGTGSWPLWLASVPALAWLGFGGGSDAPRKLVAAWTLSAWVQVALPGLFWAHYYLLPVPGLSVAVAVFLADTVAPARRRRVAAVAAASAVAAALAWTVRLQVVEYLLVPPEQLVRDKGGTQWVALRALGRDLARRSSAFRRPTLFVWGWQSPLYFYSGLPGVTRQVFADDLVRTFAAGDHPQVAPRIERTMRDLGADPPSLIFCGYAPFPPLRAFLDARYLRSHLVPASPDGRGLWVERGHYGAFETNDPVRPSP